MAAASTQWQQNLAGTARRLGGKKRGFGSGSCEQPGLHAAVWCCRVEIRSIWLAMRCARPWASRPGKGTSAEAIVAEAELVLVGHSSLQAALDLVGGTAPHGGARSARYSTSRAVETLARTAAPPRGAAAPLQEMMDTIVQIVAQTPNRTPRWTRRAAHQAAGGARPAHLDEDTDMRHGRKEHSKTFHGFKSTLPWTWTST